MNKILEVINEVADYWFDGDIDEAKEAINDGDVYYRAGSLLAEECVENGSYGEVSDAIKWAIDYERLAESFEEDIMYLSTIIGVLAFTQAG